LSEVTFEAQLELTQPTQIGTPLFQATETKIKFTVLDKVRAALDLTGFECSFIAKVVDSDTNLFVAKVCTITNAVGGLCEVDLLIADLGASGITKGELNLRSGGNGTPIDDRIQFQFNLEENGRLNSNQLYKISCLTFKQKSTRGQISACKCGFLDFSVIFI